jgi:hypothetical protein
MNITIQIQMSDKSGVPIRNWQDVSSLRNTTLQSIAREMQIVSKRYPNARVRAVDAGGRIVDIL